ncbi:MAG: SDR family oxidoreductase [Dehalococcoidia bacterium]
MAGEFEGKVALVTGGSGGIGRATSLAYAEEGAKVVVADVLVENGQETVRMIEDSGGEATFVEADVSKAAEVEAMVDKVVEAYGRIDFAYNNAGIEGVLVYTHEYPEQMWDKVIDINLKGVWLCMKYEVPYMLKQGGGAIVNTSSIAGLRGAANWSVYTASKHGVIGLTKSAAIEYGPNGVRVNAVCPSIIQTPMYDRALAGHEEQYIRAHPLRRMGTPEDVARVVIWLCSDSASFVTGQATLVDGGYLA